MHTPSTGPQPGLKKTNEAEHSLRLVVLPGGLPGNYGVAGASVPKSRWSRHTPSASFRHSTT